MTNKDVLGSIHFGKYSFWEVSILGSIHFGKYCTCLSDPDKLPENQVHFGKVPVYEILSQVDPTPLGSRQLRVRKQLGKNSSKIHLLIGKWLKKTPFNRKMVETKSQTIIDS